MAALLAPFDDEWPDSFVFSMFSEHDIRKTAVNTKAEDVTGLLESTSELHSSNPGDNFYSFKSMENLVKDADDKLLLSACFPNGKQEDCVSPAFIITEDTWLSQDEVWNTLTHNYGCVTPMDWKHSRTRSLCTRPLNLESNQRKSDVTTEMSGAEQEEEEEGLREQLDMHSIIVPFFNQEPLFTAEQVMQELEEMMQDSLDLEASLSSVNRPSRHSSGCQERLGAMSVAQLNELQEETETHVQTFSEELIQELAQREELDFEKEVKNSFISILIDVQNRQKEHRESLKRKKKPKNPPSRPEKPRGSYLTTVIPYEKKEGPPSVEDLQVLTHILQAMKNDSDKVPSLLTDYILKVLCPT